MGHSRGLTHNTRNTFHIQTYIHPDPLNKSLHSHTYQSLYHEDVLFSSSGSCAPHTGHGTNIANPECDHECIRRAIEHAITSAHSTASHTPSGTILILPRWEHTPYRHSKYINSPYTHHLCTNSNDANTFLPLDQRIGNTTPTPFGTH
jgi:DNA integrity scanning protein DisA with diadenylate cyclase activity